MEIETVKALPQKLYRGIKTLLDKNSEGAFLKHNRHIWHDFHSDTAGAEILLEAVKVASSIVSCSYLANYLAKKHNARIIAYVIENKKVNERIYKSFGCEMMSVGVSDVQRRAVDKLFDEIYPQLKTKRDVENLKVNGVWIGDLLYDSHLRKHQLPTLEIGDPRFRDSLKDALAYYVYWQDYLDTHNVKSVIVSHCVYHWYAVILRLAVSRQIPVYQVNAQTLYYISDTYYYRAYNEFFDYPQFFGELSEREKLEGVQAAKERLDRRLSGEVGVDIVYSTKSAYIKKQEKKALADSPRIKVLIATHCFFDSPHPYGVNLFPDFYEWLTFLGEISKKTDYDWYIKTHPDFMPGNIEIIQGFIKRFPKFILLPAETSHHRITEDGVNFALTIYGTIGVEYAALGVPVINASMCNPHVAYDFNIHPKSVEEYEHILLNLPNLQFHIDINQVYEYYYCRFLNNADNWLYDNYNGFLEEIGGYCNQKEPISYQKFLEQFSQRKHQQILQTLDRFVESKDYCLRKKHLPFTSETTKTPRSVMPETIAAKEEL
jgi:hypothetical protein